MRKSKKRILFSNYYDENNYEEAKNCLIEEHLDEYPEDKDWVPSENEIWNEYYFAQEINFNDFISEFKNFMKSKHFILQGNVETWHGNCRGGFMFNTFNELSKAFGDCDYIEFYDENGHLYIECSHHDGTNSFEIKILNQKGLDYADKHWDDDTETVHNKLMKNPYSILPNYAHKVWGCKKREYA